jgi:hypothetical protein
MTEAHYICLCGGIIRVDADGLHPCNQCGSREIPSGNVDEDACAADMLASIERVAISKKVAE